jgi:CRISPR-associated protein (TIGR02584 family)
LKKNVLLAVTGMSPQVITESVYAFYRRGSPIDEIKVITTTRGKKEIWLNLMLGKSGQPGMLQQLINDYHLNPIHFCEDNIFVITDDQGIQLEDARTEAEHRALADFITQIVQQETEKADQIVHASIAGGRKTMTFLLGYAMSLYGRHEDTLSHILVDEPYESSDFYYPTPYSLAIRSRFGKTEDAKDAKVSLAFIPFVRLRQELPEHLLSGKVSYTQAVTILNLAHQPFILEVEVSKKQLRIEEYVIHLPPAEMAFYWWFLDQQLTQDAPLASPPKHVPTLDYAEQYAACYSVLTDYMSADALFDTIFDHGEYGKGMEAQFFAERKTRVNKAIEQVVGREIAQQIGIQQAAKRDGKRHYAIRLPAEQIRVIKP